MPLPTFEPTPEQRKDVEEWTGCGVTQGQIAREIGIDETTLRKHFREELDHGVAKANRLVAGKLYEKAIGGHPACMIFWLKTRAGWKEISTHELTGKDGAPLIDLSTLTPDQLKALASIRLADD